MELLEEEGSPGILAKDWVEDADYESQPVVEEAFFTKGRDLQSTAVNHKYTEKEREVLGSYDSMDYLPPHSQVGQSHVPLKSSLFPCQKSLIIHARCIRSGSQHSRLGWTGTVG